MRSRFGVAALVAVLILLAATAVWLGRRSNPAVLHVALFQAPASEALRRLIPEFEKANNVKVDVEILGYADLQQKIDQQVLTHAKTYDVLMVDCILVPGYAEKGALAKLNGNFLNDPSYDGADVIPALADYLGRYPAGGDLYGVPFMSNTHMMAYRPSAVGPVAAALKLPMPGATQQTAWTWNDYARVAAAITARGKGKFYGTSLQAKPGAWLVYEWYSVLFSYVDNPTARKTGLPDFTKAGVQAAKFYTSLYHVAPKEALTWGHEEETAAMCSGETAMDATSNVELAAQLTLPACDHGEGPLQFAFPPKNAEGLSTPDMGGYGLYIASTSDRQSDAQKFLKWATSKAVHRQIVLRGGSPVRTSELNDPKVLKAYPYLKFYGQLIAASVYRARIPRWADLQDSISRNLTDVMTGKSEAEPAMEKVELDAHELTGNVR